MKSNRLVADQRTIGTGVRLLMGVHSRSHFLQMKKPGKTNDSSLAEWEWADVNTG